MEPIFCNSVDECLEVVGGLMPRILLPPAGCSPPVQFPSKGVWIIDQSCNREIVPQMTIRAGWSAFDDSNIVAFDFVKQFDLRPLVIRDSFIAESTHYPFDSLFFDVVERHCSTPVTQ
jgi:hypothetical protein